MKRPWAGGLRLMPRGPRRRSLPVLLCITTAVLLLSCSAGAPMSAADLLTRYGWRPVGEAHVLDVVVGEHGDMPWALYRSASAEIGLSLPSAGSTCQLGTYELESAQRLLGHVLVCDEQLAGAWLSNDSVPGVFALSEVPR